LIMSKSPGIGKLVFGLEKLSPHGVKLENGRILYRPLLDCRPCALLNLVCEELDYPCTFLLRECRKRRKNCEACRRFAECLEEKPCCWDCPYLMECLKMAKEGGGEAFVKLRFRCSWEEFEAAVKMLVENEKDE